MQSWDELVKTVGEARRRQREVDGLLFNEVWRYLDNRRDEEVETLQEVELPDGRKKGSKFWHGVCAFTFQARNGELIVRAGADAGPPEPFPGLAAASGRMAEFMCEQKDRAFRELLRASGDQDARVPPLYPA
jgi:hypothetical protein